MNYIDIILFICFIILCSITIYTLYNRIEGFANPVEVPEEVKEFIKIVGKLGEQATKVADALEKTQRPANKQNTSSTTGPVDTSSAAFLKGAKQISQDDAKKELKKQEEQSSDEDKEKITITTKARDNLRLPIFDYESFNQFIEANPTPTLNEIYPFIKDTKEYKNLLDTLYDLVENEVSKMNDQLNKRKEAFISEAFRTVCCNVPDDSKDGSSHEVKELTPIEKDATLEKIKSITTQLQSRENIKKILFIDAAFSKMNEIKNKAEKGKSEDLANEYSPESKGGEND